jgi:hypothetical protein
MRRAWHRKRENRKLSFVILEKSFYGFVCTEDDLLIHRYRGPPSPLGKAQERNRLAEKPKFEDMPQSMLSTFVRMPTKKLPPFRVGEK